MTPEQYRALADNATETGEYSIEDRWIRSAQTALRAAADEVDCLRDVVNRRDEQLNLIAPERYRGIAGELAGNPTTYAMQEAISALRSAADQLEAVQGLESLYDILKDASDD